MTRVIGLTGGIGSGKSVVARYLAELGAAVIDADRVGHDVFHRGTEAWQDVVATFGRQILNPDGEIDRGRLGEMVFADSSALAKLNRIMHPRMREVIKAQIEEYRGQGVGVVVLEAAVLLEAGWDSLVDEVWVMVAPEGIAIRRAGEQHGLSEEQVTVRLRSQLAAEERIKYADVVIHNDGSLGELKEKVKDLWERLRGK